MTLAKKRAITFLLAFALVFAGVAILSADYSYAASKKPAQVKELKCTKSKTDANAFTLKWKKAKNAKKYQVYSGYMDEETNKIVWQKEATVTKTSWKGSQGQLYTTYYRVRAINGSTKGKYSSKIKVKLAVKKYPDTIVPDFGGLFNWVLAEQGTEGAYTCYYYRDDMLGSDTAYLYALDYATYLWNHEWAVDGDEYVKDGVRVCVSFESYENDNSEITIMIK